MLSGSGFIKSLFATIALTVSIHVWAQDLPGSEVSDSAVSQSAVTLVNLAAQVYPELFGQATTWRSYEGFHYKYFGSSGIYIGVQDTNLYLMGGPFGNEPTFQGQIADAIVVVQAAAGTATAPFQDYITAITLVDLLNYFSKLTMEYGSSSTLGSLVSRTDAAITLEAVGQEQVDGATTNRLKITLTASNVAAPVIYDMWVNSTGTVVRLATNGTEFPASTARVVGPSLVSGMLLALVAADQPLVKSVAAGVLADNTAVSQRTSNQTIGGVAVQSITITVSSSASNAIDVELSDFGAFTMATSFSSALDAGIQKSTAYFRFVDVVLR